VPTETLYPYPGERRWKRIFFSDPTFHEPEYMAIDLRAKEPLNHGWFVYLRLYGPEKPYFDKTWVPGDLEVQD
jgi:hypothetical protein